MPSRRPTAPRGPRRGAGASARAGGTGGPSSGPGSRPGGTARPAAAARPRSTAAGREPSAPRGLTRRAAVLAVLVLVAAVAVAPYLRSLAEQQAKLSALRADVADRGAAVEELQAELDRWDDPAFVMARARERLFMVMPGEVGYVVLDPPTQEEIAPDDAASVAQAATSTGEQRPWFGSLWESVRLAAVQTPAAEPQPATPNQPVPAPEITDPGPGAPTQGSP